MGLTSQHRMMTKIPLEISTPDEGPFFLLQKAFGIIMVLVER
jgi:hypothetical protein